MNRYLVKGRCAVRGAAREGTYWCRSQLIDDLPVCSAEGGDFIRQTTSGEDGIAKMYVLFKVEASRVVLYWMRTIIFGLV